MLAAYTYAPSPLRAAVGAWGSAQRPCLVMPGGVHVMVVKERQNGVAELNTLTIHVSTRACLTHSRPRTVHNPQDSARAVAAAAVVAVGRIAR